MGERWPFGRSKGRFNGTSRQLLRRLLYMLNKRLHLWICVSLPLMQHGNHWLVVKPSQDNTYYIYVYARNYIEIIPVWTDTCLPVVCLTWAVQPPNTMRFAVTFQPFACKFQCYIYTRENKHDNGKTHCMKMYSYLLSKMVVFQLVILLFGGKHVLSN